MHEKKVVTDTHIDTDLTPRRLVILSLPRMLSSEGQPKGNQHVVSLLDVHEIMGVFVCKS